MFTKAIFCQYRLRICLVDIDWSYFRLTSTEIIFCQYRPRLFSSDIDWCYCQLMSPEAIFCPTLSDAIFNQRRETLLFADINHFFGPTLTDAIFCWCLPMLFFTTSTKAIFDPCQLKLFLFDVKVGSFHWLQPLWLSVDISQGDFLPTSAKAVFDQANF